MSQYLDSWTLSPQRKSNFWLHSFNYTKFSWTVGGVSCKDDGRGKCLGTMVKGNVRQWQRWSVVLNFQTFILKIFKIHFLFPLNLPWIEKSHNIERMNFSPLHSPFLPSKSHQRSIHKRLGTKSHQQNVNLQAKKHAVHATPNAQTKDI